MAYQWWQSSWGQGIIIEGATESVYVTWLPNEDFFQALLNVLVNFIFGSAAEYVFGPISFIVYCTITGYEKDEHGNIISQKTLTSDWVRSDKESIWAVLFQAFFIYPVLAICIPLVIGFFTFGLYWLFIPYAAPMFYFLLLFTRLDDYFFNHRKLGEAF